MQEIQGNCWDYLNKASICVLTNMTVRKDNKLIMGGGQALEAAKRFPELPARWGNYYLTRHRDGSVICVNPIELDVYKNPHFIISFPTKTDPRLKSDLDLIATSARDLVAWFKLLNCGQIKYNDDIIIPRPGCGLGGLNWENQVKPILEPILEEDRYKVITF